MTEDREEYFKRYGWSCNETNLKTLPETAPEEIKGLAKWLTLEGRRSSIEEYLNCVGEDSRIHGKFWHIGAWTHRMSHSSPNQANIPSVFSDEPKSAVEEVKAKYDGRIRELFHAGEGYLVGTDADSIQLRILTHYMKSEDYREAILTGDKSKGTDIHSLNGKLLDLKRSRDDFKTFIYAWILGAGLPKVASILKCSTSIAKQSQEKFVTRLPGLKKLKSVQIPRDAARGFFYGLDGRKVQCNSEHLMLAGYLQNGEAVIMKMAFIKWYHWAIEEGLRFEVVDFVHDEWQTIVYGTKEDAERMGYLQRQALRTVGEELNLFCPLDGSTSIGRNWKQTH